MQVIVADDCARWAWDEQDLFDALGTARRLLSKSVAGIDMIEGTTAHRVEDPTSPLNCGPCAPQSPS